MRLSALAATATLMLGGWLGAARADAAAPSLAFPLACEIGRDCEIQHYFDRDPGPGVLDYRCGQRTYQGHDGLDIRLKDLAEERAGIAVLAAAAGRVAGLRDGQPDISIRAPGAASVAGKECGNGVVVDHGAGWVTQYCHLARGSVRVKVGEAVAAGQPLGRVGLSGDTEFPHLHLTVRHDGRAVDPFSPEPGAAPGSCVARSPLWDAAALRRLAYKPGAVLNTGFTTAAVDNGGIEAGGLPAPDLAAPALVAYVRLIELEAGDRVELILTGPDGAVLRRTLAAPLDRQKAQYFAYLGAPRPVAGWRRGTYGAQVRVLRAGHTAITRSWTIGL
ncbi:M23 family metallopeptidase [Phenylobacterium sp.]|uniref:M23 family metallopeptidase n=1 Tax=Phenylobacterium sp. TaxID=1871053 RepID=UPI00286D42C4|nr:M23 family metallopeptidase [Phenylobacterium sp.]